VIFATPSSRHTDPVLDDDTRELLQAVADMAGSIGDKVPVERFYHEREIGLLFDRCRGMFGALRVLLANGFVQEAAVLARPLFVDSVALAELAAADEPRRTSLVVGRQLHATADIEGIFMEMQARGDEVAKNLEHVAERRRKVEQYAQRHSASTRHWDPEGQIKTLAEKHGRGDEYPSFRLSHHFVHGSAAITESRFSVDDNDVARIGAPHLGVDIWERPTALFRAYSLLLACRATCSIFPYEEPQQLEELLRRIESIIRKTDESEQLAK
jgi:hypothetical protein